MIHIVPRPPYVAGADVMGTFSAVWAVVPDSPSSFAASVSVNVSPDLLICGGLLALYLGFAKRRQELMLLGGDSANHRKVLGDYGPAFLDQMSVVLLAVTVVSYIMYTLSPERVAMSGHRKVELMLRAAKGLGAIPTLAKPFEQEALLALVAEELDWVREGAAARIR